MEKNKSIRVLVANRPRLMRDLVLATISEGSDIEVVGEAASETEIWQRVERTRPDCLIVALDQFDVRPAICDVLLRDFPEMKILALSAGHDSSILFWASFHVHSRRVEASENRLLGAIREASAKGVAP
jgi:DNA-binding NarL/FixJ family response regulator